MNNVVKAEVIDGANKVLSTQTNVENALEALRSQKKEIQWYCKLRVVYDTGEKILLSVRREQ